MFRVATADLAWPIWRAEAAVFDPLFQRNTLKPLGHCVAIDQIRRTGARRVLEVGHGAGSPSMALLAGTLDYWGLDDTDVDATVPVAALAALRARLPAVQFRHGYLGAGPVDLPEGHFDLVFSVSVIEHVPKDRLVPFHQHALRLLRPGGILFHSYDVPWGMPVAHMRAAILAAGLHFVEAGVHVPWDIETGGFGAAGGLPSPSQGVVFENMWVVMRQFSQRIPEETRRHFNWVTILIAARKPS